MAIFFVCFIPVRLLRPNKAVFVPCDCKLQRAYREFQNYEVITMSVVGGQLTEKKKKKNYNTHIEVRTFLISDYY